MSIQKQELRDFIGLIIGLAIFPVVGYLYSGGSGNLLIDIPLSLFALIVGAMIIHSLFTTASTFIEDYYVEKRAKKLNGEEKQRT